jgi:hypothetical protein
MSTEYEETRESQPIPLFLESIIDLDELRLIDDFFLGLLGCF